LCTVGNKNKDGAYINLKGVGVGNGLTDTVVQYQYYAEMAMNNSYGIKTVSEAVYQSMVDAIPKYGVLHLHPLPQEVNCPH